ncbi:MAG: RNA polymerase sigma factor [bacterium]
MVNFTIGEDERIMLQYQKGDTSEIEALIQKHSGWVYHILCKWTKNNAIVDDLSQDTWRKVFSAAPRYKPSAPFGGWLYNIARNTFLDWCRKKTESDVTRSNNPDHNDDNPAEHIPATDVSPVLYTTQNQLLQSLKSCIKTLSDENRHLIDMFRNDIPQRQIAEKLKYALGTVNKRLKSALQLLSTCLEKKGWSASDIMEIYNNAAL